MFPKEFKKKISMHSTINALMLTLPFPKNKNAFHYAHFKIIIYFSHLVNIDVVFVKKISKLKIKKKSKYMDKGTKNAKEKK